MYFSNLLNKIKSLFTDTDSTYKATAKFNNEKEYFVGGEHCTHEEFVESLRRSPEEILEILMSKQYIDMNTRRQYKEYSAEGPLTVHEHELFHQQYKDLIAKHKK